jgi:hypothetical protein
MMGAPSINPAQGPSVFGSTPAPMAAAPAPKKSNLPIFIAIGAVVVIVIGIVIFLLMQHSGATTPAAK